MYDTLWMEYNAQQKHLAWRGKETWSLERKRDDSNAPRAAWRSLVTSSKNEHAVKQRLRNEQSTNGTRPCGSWQR